MHVEGVGKPVVLETPEIGDRAKSEFVTHVLVEGGWCEIIPGSFKILQTEVKDPNKQRAIPFVKYDMNVVVDSAGNTRPLRVELTSPSALHAVAYPPEVDE